MNADQVRAYVAAKWPNAMQSPLAQAVRANCADDEAGQAVEFAQLQARATEREMQRVRSDAMKHALSCLTKCNGWDEDELSHNIESNFPELDMEACDEIARRAMEQNRRSR